MKVVFTLSSGRSGTGFLSELFIRNIPGAVALHEPAPSMNGQAIDWFERGATVQLAELFETKARFIRTFSRQQTPLYLESSHLFLKSFAEVAVSHYPCMRLVHLVRNLLEVARSHMNRANSSNHPYLVSKDNPYSINPNPEVTPIFRDLGPLSEYQKFLVQWIEIENRGQAFLDRFNLRCNCVTLHTPADLISRRKIGSLLGWLGFGIPSDSLDLTGNRNANYKKTEVGPLEEDELAGVLELMAPCYLDIFHREPYTTLDAPWLEILKG
jgi:hypothetical protein